MEFGVFIQNPVFGFKREGNPNYEHEVIMRELELVQAAKAWLQERLAEIPALKPYLDNWGDWNPWP